MQFDWGMAIGTILSAMFGGKLISWVRRFLLTGFVLSAASAIGQFAVHDLGPGEQLTTGMASSGNQQVGSREGGQVAYEALVWFGTPESVVSLNPAGEFFSFANSTNGLLQVGRVAHYAGFSVISRAVIWAGSAESVVYLSAANGDSNCWAIHNGQQAGYDSIYFQRGYEAVLWTGTAQSRQSLHPAGYTESQAWDTFNGQQVGVAWLNGVKRAGLWQGTAGSWVDLHPTSATQSHAYGTNGTSQVGSADVAGQPHASIWNGSASSWTDLHPSGADQSVALEVADNFQVGSTGPPLDQNAVLWTGNADSALSLHSYLPKGSWYSSARGLEIANDRLIVTGTRSPRIACQWISKLIQPTNLTVQRGLLIEGNNNSLAKSDNNRLTISPGVVLTTMQAPIQLKVSTTIPQANPASLGILIEARGTSSSVIQTVSLKNYVSNNYETVEQISVSTVDRTRIVSIREDPERFVDAVSGEVEAIITYRALGPVLVYPWRVAVDQINWMFPD